MLEIVNFVLEGVRDEVHEHQLLLSANLAGDPGLFLLVAGQKVRQVLVDSRFLGGHFALGAGEDLSLVVIGRNQAYIALTPPYRVQHRLVIPLTKIFNS